MDDKHEDVELIMVITCPHNDKNGNYRRVGIIQQGSEERYGNMKLSKRFRNTGMRTRARSRPAAKRQPSHHLEGSPNQKSRDTRLFFGPILKLGPPVPSLGKANALQTHVHAVPIPSNGPCTLALRQHSLSGCVWPSLPFRELFSFPNILPLVRFVLENRIFSISPHETRGYSAIRDVYPSSYDPGLCFSSSYLAPRRYNSLSQIFQGDKETWLARLSASKMTALCQKSSSCRPASSGASATCHRTSQQAE